MDESTCKNRTNMLAEQGEYDYTHTGYSKVQTGIKKKKEAKKCEGLFHLLNSWQSSLRKGQM